MSAPKYFLELLKIISGAMNADRRKVSEYSKLLASKLEEDGEAVAARKLWRVLNNSKNVDLSVSEVKSSHIPVDSESRVDLADEKFYHAEEVTVFLEPDHERKLSQFLRHAQQTGKLIAHGVEIPPSLLLYGPPGCGKTELAKYIAAQVRLPLVTIRIDSLISSYLGSTSKNIRRLFDFASARPCVLFLDEFDAVAKVRDDSHELGELKRVVVSLLQNIDALGAETILVAATNHEHLLDKAIWRRFTYKLNLDMPETMVRSKLFSSYIGDYIDSKDTAILVIASQGLSGADIRTLALSAISNAILEDRDRIDMPDTLLQILKFNNPDLLNPSHGPADQARAIHAMNIEGMTYKLIGDLVGRSEGTAHKYINQEV